MIPRVLFLSNVPWDFVWQRHQTLATLWASVARVDYVELPGMRRPELGDAGRIVGRAMQLLGGRRRGASGASTGPTSLTIHRPWVLPAVTRTLCAFNRRLVERVIARSPALAGPYDLAVVYSPARTTLQWLDRVSCRRLVFDCTDDLTAVRGVPEFFAADEAALLARADLTVVPSQVLLARKRGGARRIALLPHGARVERFLPTGPRIRHDERTTVLYYGHLHRQHLDFEALERLARERPAWRIILAGPVRTPHRWPANVELPGQVPHERLRNYVDQADALLLPYLINRYTEAVMPAKTYECLATGLPVVAAPLPELTAAFSGEMAFVAAGESWALRVESVLRDDTPVAQEGRIRLAKANTWTRRFEEMVAMVDRLEGGT